MNALSLRKELSKGLSSWLAFEATCHREDLFAPNTSPTAAIMSQFICSSHFLAGTSGTTM